MMGADWIFDMLKLYAARIANTLCKLPTVWLTPKLMEILSASGSVMA